jgi:hypothetical protein
VILHPGHGKVKGPWAVFSTALRRITAWLTGAEPQAKRPVEPVLGTSARFKLPAYAYGQDLVFCIFLFCMIRSQIQI